MEFGDRREENGQSRGSWPDLQHTVGILGNTENTESHFGEKEDNGVEEMRDMDSKLKPGLSGKAMLDCSSSQENKRHLDMVAEKAHPLTRVLQEPLAPWEKKQQTPLKIYSFE